LSTEWSDLLSESAIAVFRERAGILLHYQTSGTRRPPAWGRPVMVIIGVTGSSRGQIVFALDQRFADAVALALAVPTNRAMGALAEAIASRATGRRFLQLPGPTLSPAIVLTAEAPSLDFLTECAGLTLGSPSGSLEIDYALTGTEEANHGNTER